jgi:uncharacterized protein (DUF362 family)
MMNSNQPLSRRGNTNQIVSAAGKPLLVIVEGSDIDAMIDIGLEAIGGLGRVIGDHKQVVLKPNTNQRDPFPSITAPETIRAVARHCRNAGVKQIVVHEDHKQELDLYYNPAELPGIDIQISHSQDVSQYVMVEYDRWHGDMDTAEALGNLDGSEMRGPGSNLTKDFEKTEGPRLRIARALPQAPVIINLPVLKRHAVGQITSALKNHVGSVYGPHRWIAHAAAENNHDYFDRKIAEFASAVRPELTITDVRSIQAVFGPFRRPGTKIIDNVNHLIITGDMVAADVIALDLMKKYDNTFTAEMEAIVRRQHEHAEELGIGISDLSKLEVIRVKV